MLSLTGQIRIDGNKTAFSRCSIESSFDADTDTATVVLPLSSVSNELEGRKITIYLGYKKHGLNPEFAGHITEIISYIPQELKCHSHLHSLRTVRLNKKFFKKKLSSILKFSMKSFNANVLVDDDITVTTACYWKTARWFIEFLSKKYGYIPIYDGHTLHFKKPYQEKVNNSLPVFEEGFNVIQNNLQYKTNKSVSRVQVISENEKGYRIRGAFGKLRNNTKQVIIEGLHSSRDCYTRAKEIYQELHTSGFVGSFNTFGFPFIKVGEPCIFYSNQDNQSGVYYVDNTETTFSPQGFRRTVGLGKKANIPIPQNAQAIL